MQQLLWRRFPDRPQSDIHSVCWKGKMTPATPAEASQQRRDWHIVRQRSVLTLPSMLSLALFLSVSDLCLSLSLSLSSSLSLIFLHSRFSSTYSLFWPSSSLFIHTFILHSYIHAVSQGGAGSSIQCPYGGSSCWNASNLAYHAQDIFWTRLDECLIMVSNGQSCSHNRCIMI